MLLLMLAALAQVATVNGQDVEDEKLELKASRHQGELSDEQRLEWVDQLVDQELMLQEARRLGYQDDEKVQTVLRNLLLRQEIYSTVRYSDFADEDLLAWYEAHRAEYAVPQKRQVRTITLAGGGSEVRAEAWALKDRLEADGLDGFKEAASAQSQDGFAARGGDNGFIARDGKEGVDPAVVEAAFSLPEHTLSEPIRTEQGWTLVLVTATRHEVERSFEQVRGTVLRELKNERYAALYDAYVLSLSEGRVEVDRAWVREHGPVRYGVEVRRLGAAAKVDGTPIQGDDVEGLEAAIADHLLLVEAIAQGLLDEPKIEKVMVNTYLRDTLYSQVSNEDFSDDELRAYFEANREDFMVPEKVHLKMASVSFGEERTREEARVLAEGLRDQVPRRPFADIATELSEDPYKRRGGDVGWVTAEGKPGLDPLIVETVFGLPMGGFALIEVEGAWVVVVKEGEREGVERTYEQLKGSVLRQVKNERYQALYEERMVSLRASASVVVHEEHVLSLDLRTR